MATLKPAYYNFYSAFSAKSNHFQSQLVKNQAFDQACVWASFKL